MNRTLSFHHMTVLAASYAALAGCATPERRPDPWAPAPNASAAPVTCDRARDRAAILSMAGEYDVKFSFDETVALAPAYEIEKPYRAAASELVLVVESSEEKVVLQHILAVNDDGKRAAIKHWRQDWTFEDDSVLEYQGGRRWVKKRLGPESSRCGWTQAVFEINDGPRYEGWGRFVHAGGTSTWTSNETRRPLPRREQARHDYDVIVGINRHTMTPAGWVHEQDNTKVALRAEPRALVRERGVNTYTRSGGGQLSVAHDFWRQHEAFWRDVRVAWERLVGSRASLTLRAGTGASALYQDILAMEARPPAERIQSLEEVLLRHLDSAIAGR